ncbi:ComEC/Rec2 family competence protein [Microbacterium pseudoresistens]
MVPVCAAAWPVALLAVCLPATSGWLILAGAVFGVVAAMCAVRAPRGVGRSFLMRWAGVGIVMAAVVSGIGGAVLLADGARSEAASLGGGVVHAVLTVQSSASVGADGRLWMDAQTQVLGRGDAPDARSVPVRVGVPQGEDGVDIAPGTVLELSAETAVADAGERAVLVLFALGEPSILTRGPLIARIAADVRSAFITRSATLPEPGAQLLPGLAVGDTRAVTPELDAAMKASGLSHLTAVSGSNCALVIAAGFGLVALLGGGRVLRVVVAALGLAAFVVLVTAEPSVIRAAAMAAIAMLCLLLGRPRAGLPMLAAAVAVLLVTDPWLSMSAGFALSAAATGALILLAPPLARGMRRWLPAPLALALAVPLSAQLVCGPIIALFTDQQSIIGVAANIVAAPAAPLATVLGLLACLAMPVPPLADLFAACAWLPSAWIAQTALTSAEVPGGLVTAPAGVVSALVIALLSAAFAWLLATGGTRRHRTVTWLSGVVLALACGLGTGTALLDGPAAPLTRPSDWGMAACDIGQGDALLLRSAGHVMLVDTGPDPALLQSCLDSVGIGRIDVLVLTHFDQDHAGAAPALAGRVGTVMHSPADGARAQRTLDVLRDGGARLVAAVAGQRGPLGTAQWRVLWPRRDERVFPPGNDLSVVIDIGGGGVPRTLLLGDLSAASQRMLLRLAHPSGYDVVKVAHHGSADQEPALYAGLGARIAVISAGLGNDYGHPRAPTLEVLADNRLLIARTDLQGQILISGEGDDLRIWSEHGATPEQLRAPAEPGR